MKAGTCLVAAALAALPLGAAAFGGVGTITGRMVLPRVDTPSVTPAGSVRGQYVLHCAGCHGLDGAGSPAAYVPDLRRLGQFLQVPGGREFVIGVPGVMGSGLDDVQVAAVTNWLLATLARDSVHGAPAPYTATEVARVRAAALVDVAARRQQLVQQGRALGLAID